ncbi:hypothetical protein GYH30_021277 [Glycine max]|nr:hypothetical protein GYH30_021277 [Glycine max]
MEKRNESALPSCRKMQMCFCLAKQRNPRRWFQQKRLAPLALVMTAMVSKKGSLWNAMDSESGMRKSLDSTTVIESMGFFAKPLDRPKE